MVVVVVDLKLRNGQNDLSVVVFIFTETQWDLKDALKE